jgi:hypothetical protein
MIIINVDKIIFNLFLEEKVLDSQNILKSPEVNEPMSQNPLSSSSQDSFSLKVFSNSFGTQNSEDTVKSSPFLSDDSQGKISLHDCNYCR